jgi:hypothetical protein
MCQYIIKKVSKQLIQENNHVLMNELPSNLKFKFILSVLMNLTTFDTYHLWLLAIACALDYLYFEKYIWIQVLLKCSIFKQRFVQKYLHFEVLVVNISNRKNEIRKKVQAHREENESREWKIWKKKD